MAYPTLGQDAWTELCGALITGQRANQDLSSLDTALRNGSFGLWRAYRPYAFQSIVSPQHPDQKRGCSATEIENARWRLKIVSVASAARPKNYLRDRLSTSPSSLSSITGTILSSMRSLHISETSVSAGRRRFQADRNRR